MTTLFDARLSDRNFGSQLLRTPDLQEWVKSKRLHLRTTPPLDGYEFVQVERLLFAIQNHSGNLTKEQALEIVMNDPVLKNDPIFQKYPDDIDPTTCRWLLGAESHRKWRVLITAAIEAKELELLEFGSKLPVNATMPSVAPVPDVVDRLAQLRALGGTSTYANGDWKFTRIGALSANEKAAGRNRNDEKTIREDLKNAAQKERDAGRAGAAADPWNR